MSGNPPTCQIHQKYPEIQCPNTALSLDPEGLCLLHSQDVNKNQVAFNDAVKAKLVQENYDFRGVIFPGTFRFSGQKFTKMANFFMAVFYGDTDFTQVTFSGKANFFGAAFDCDADFFSAIFCEEADFVHAKFSGSVGFISATFSGNANFWNSTFSGEAAFSKATFLGEASFLMSMFDVRLRFHSAVISPTGRVLLVEVNPRNKGTHRQPFIADFRFLRQEPGGRLLFQDISLAQVEFTGTNLRKVEFDRVFWAYKWSRAVVYDEILLHQREKPSFKNFALVERLYRQLKANREDERDFKRMGDFHYGEMEMHRRASKWRWCPVYFYNLYWFLSGYGERPLRALGWLAAFLALFTAFIAWAGLDLDPKHIPAFGDSFFYLLQKVTLQRPTWAEPMGFWGKLVAGFSVLLIPGQAALFLLALRNRLGRRR